MAQELPPPVNASPARPLPFGAAVPPPPPGAANRDAGTKGEAKSDGATVDEPGGEAAVELTFWQHPFVQNVMPFISSLLLHAAILTIGILLIKPIQHMVRVVTDQVIIPDAKLSPNNQAGGIPNPGTGGEDRRAEQDKFPDADPNSQGLSDKPNKDLNQALTGGGSGDAEDNPFAGGPNSGSGKGKHGIGGGKGEGEGGGSGDGGLGSFGRPGGGMGLGPKSKFLGTGGNAMKIVFVCDATGSMMSRFDLLRVQLHRTLDNLQFPQQFNVVFFQENAKPPISPSLIRVTPENMQRMFSYISDYTAKGPTDPMPALKTALAMRPQLVYFLCDPSDFPDKPGMIKWFRENNPGKAAINTLQFIDNDPEGKTMLEQISKDSGGQYKQVTDAMLSGDQP